MANVAAVAAAVMMAAGGATSTAAANANATRTATATSTSTPTSTSRPTSASDGIPTLTLADALAELERQNLTLAQARSRADEAAALVGQARSALLPSVTAQGSYVRNSDEFRLGPISLQTPAGSFVIDRTVQPLETFSAAGSVRVPLVVPQAWYDVAAARSGARAAEASADAVRLQIRAGFAQAAHSAAAADEVVVASERAVTSAAELARSAERRVRAGTAAPLDVLKAQTEQVRRESDLAGARAEAERGRLALGILLGRDAPVRVAVADLPGAAPPADGTALLDEALARRPELVAQRAQLDAAEAAVRSSRARLAPQLSASASAFAQDVPLATGKREGWRATVDLTWLLYDGGFREARQRQASAQRASAQAAAEAERLAVTQDVADSTRNLAVARERLRLAETQGKLASDAAASARRSFDAGVASSLDVIDANDRLYQADVGLAEARARLAQAGVALERALGR